MFPSLSLCLLPHLSRFSIAISLLLYIPRCPPFSFLCFHISLFQFISLILYIPRRPSLIPISTSLRLCIQRRLSLYLILSLLLSPYLSICTSHGAHLSIYFSHSFSLHISPFLHPTAPISFSLSILLSLSVLLYSPRYPCPFSVNLSPPIFHCIFISLQHLEK